MVKILSRDHHPILYPSRGSCCRGVPPRGRSESPRRTVAAEARRIRENLEREATSRRAAEAALVKRKKEVEKLQEEITAYKVGGYELLNSWKIDAVSARQQGFYV